MRLISLAFNLDPAGAGDGTLTLRESVARQVPLPEWQQGRSSGHAASPVAYVLSELGTSVPVVAVTVERESGDPERAAVRALTGAATSAPLPPATLLPPDLVYPPTHWFSSYSEYSYSQAYRAYYELWQQSRQESVHPLGPVPSTEVRFDDGPRATVLVPLLGARLAGRGVAVADITWRWQSSHRTRGWTDIERTEHRIYTVLRPPTAPWHRRPSATNDTQLPWVDALDVACRWATGSGEISEAAAAVTQAVNSLGTDLIEYGCPIGAMSMYASPLGFDVFDCTAFIDLVGGGAGNGPYVNCTDCASIVSTFANLLGCDLWQSRMGSYVPAFLTNPIQAIGSDRLGSPCGWGLGFTYHEVAWERECTSDDDVYDACVRFAVEGRSDGAATTVPTGVRFGADGDGQYRDQMAAPTSRAVCVPRPSERKRRVLV